MTDKDTTQKDYYYVLGINQDASIEDIHDAYERLYQKFGPHVTFTGQDPDLMLKTLKEITEAYEVLSNPERRKQFDSSGTLHSSRSDLRRLWAKSAGPTQKKDEKSELKIAADTTITVTVTLKEAVKGGRKELLLKDAAPCQDCTGLKPLVRMKCPNCRGIGFTREDRKEEITLPAGLVPGQEIRLANHGTYDTHLEKRGDLVLKIEFEPHPHLSISEKNIVYNAPVSIFDAILGADIEVPTATGKVVMKVQPLSQNGRVYRLRGLGLAGGDQLVTIDLRIPESISSEEKSLVQRLANLRKDADAGKSNK